MLVQLVLQGQRSAYVRWYSNRHMLTFDRLKLQQDDHVGIISMACCIKLINLKLLSLQSEHFVNVTPL